MDPLKYNSLCVDGKHHCSWEVAPEGKDMTMEEFINNFIRPALASLFNLMGKDSGMVEL